MHNKGDSWQSRDTTCAACLEVSCVIAGFAVVLATCTNVATSACVAFGASMDTTAPTKTTKPKNINTRFAIFIFSPFRVLGLGRKFYGAKHQAATMLPFLGVDSQ